MHKLALTIVFLVAVAAAVVAADSQATAPGKNGLIAYAKRSAAVTSCSRSVQTGQGTGRSHG